MFYYHILIMLLICAARTVHTKSIVILFIKQTRYTYAEKYFQSVRRIKIFDMGPQILKKFYSCIIKRTGCITAWYGNYSASDCKALQRVVRTAQYIIGAKLPAIQDLYTRRCQRKAQKTAKDSSHPSHRLFSLLTHDKWYRSTKSRFKKKAS
jgi:gmma-aminobutyric acid receptor subunit gamma